MTATASLRTSVIGLVAFAAAEEQMLLAASSPGEAGDAACWAAPPLIAHNAEFRRQQVERLAAIRDGRTPDEYGDVDHASAQVYERYQALPADRVAERASASASDLISYLSLTSDEDLREPARNPRGPCLGNGWLGAGHRQVSGQSRREASKRGRRGRVQRAVPGPSWRDPALCDSSHRS